MADPISIKVSDSRLKAYLLSQNHEIYLLLRLYQDDTEKFIINNI